MKITIVMPAFNESRRIGEVLKELQKSKLPIVVVDDGSKDSTFAEVKKYKVTAFRHKINLGKGAALKTGCDAAFCLGAEAIIMMDSDGQHTVSDLPKFIKALESKNYDIIFGSRNLNMGVPLVRYLGNKFASILVSHLFGIYITDLICGYRAFTKKAYQQVRWLSSGYGVETEMVIRSGDKKLRRCEVLVETVYHDNFKGVTILDAIGILTNVLKWKISRFK